MVARCTTSPQHEDKILVFRRQWLDLILARKKTLELRGKMLAEGPYWLGCKGQIQGKVTLGRASLIENMETFRNTKAMHCVDSDNLPYKKTWAFELLQLQALPEPVSYIHPKGAVGIVRFRG